jgi:hypothetical protein
MNIEEIYNIGIWMQFLKTIILRMQQSGKQPRIIDWLMSRKSQQSQHGQFIDPLENILNLLRSTSLAVAYQKEIIQWIYRLNKIQALNAHKLHNFYSDWIRWDDRIKSELSSTPVIRLYTSGLFNVKRLLKGAKSFFKEDVWIRLSKTAKNDLADTVKCLLCNLPTPAVMISLRAIEDVLRQYYKYKTKQEPGRKNWKVILNELLAKNEKGGPKYNVNITLLGLLDYIRENERNVVEHPDKRFEQEEAEGIFSEVIKTINEIYRDIPQQSFWDGTRGKG